MKPFLAVVAIAAIATTLYSPLEAMAQVDVNIVIGNPPPPQRVERIPAPRRGYVWVPGYWDWRGHRYVWYEGHWEPVRVGQIYERPEWRHERDGWRLYRGGWRQEERRERVEDRNDRHDDHRWENHDHDRR